MKRATLFLTILIGVTATTILPAGAVDSYKIGQKAPSGDLVFIVHGFTDPATSDNQFVQPDPGNRFVSVDVEVINKQSEQELFSALAGFTLLTKDRREYDMTFMPVTEPGAPDGEIPAKFSSRGWVTFEIPETAQLKYLRAKGNFTANGALIRLKMPAPAPAAP